MTRLQMCWARQPAANVESDTLCLLWDKTLLVKQLLEKKLSWCIINFYLNCPVQYHLQLGSIHRAKMLVSLPFRTATGACFQDLLA